MNTLTDIIDKLNEIFNSIDVKNTTTTQEGLDAGNKTFAIKSIKWKKNLDYRLYTINITVNFGNFETFVDLYTNDFEHELAHCFEVEEGGIESDKGELSLILKTNW